MYAIDLSGKHVASYLAAMVESAALWGLLLFAASSRRGPLRWITALLFVGLAALAVGGQLYFHRQYSTYLNLDATLFGTSFSESLFSQLRADGKNFLTSVVPPILLATALVWVGRSIIRPRGSRISRGARYAAPIAVCAALVIPCSYRARSPTAFARRSASAISRCSRRMRATSSASRTKRSCVRCASSGSASRSSSSLLPRCPSRHCSRDG